MDEVVSWRSLKGKMWWRKPLVSVLRISLTLKLLTFWPCKFIKSWRRDNFAKFCRSDLREATTSLNLSTRAMRKLHRTSHLTQPTYSPNLKVRSRLSKTAASPAQTCPLFFLAWALRRSQAEGAQPRSRPALPSRALQAQGSSKTCLTDCSKDRRHIRDTRKLSNNNNKHKVIKLKDQRARKAHFTKCNPELEFVCRPRTIKDHDRKFITKPGPRDKASTSSLIVTTLDLS